MPSAPTDSVSSNDELTRRPSRPPDHEAENRALNALASELSNPSGNILARLADAALELCRAHSSGVSLIEMSASDKIFRWHGTSGLFAPFMGGSMPFEASPCGVVIESNAVQLMRYPDRHFPALLQASPRIVEALLVPFHMLGEPVGTIWAISHDEERSFTAEDSRLIHSLARFASGAFVLRSALQSANDAREELARANARLNRSNDKLWRKLVESGLERDP